MTLEGLADLIRANSANTNGHIVSVDERIDSLRSETTAASMNIQNDLTDVRSETKDMREEAAGLRREVGEVRSDVAEVRRSLDSPPPSPSCAARSTSSRPRSPTRSGAPAEAIGRASRPPSPHVRMSASTKSQAAQQLRRSPPAMARAQRD
jgi:hypothetical protein